MKITKINLCDLPSCYAAAAVNRSGRTLLLLAPDGEGPCYAFDSETLKQETVWDGPGGTMAIVPLPGGNGDFLAVQRFFPGFQAQGTEIVHVKCRGGKWLTNTFLKLPYLHRFDILERGGVRYLLCATLCMEKRSEDDWTSPGGLYAAVLPEALNEPVKLTHIAGGMTRNHGFLKVNQSMVLTSCDQGVYEVMPPAGRGEKWQIKRVFNQPVSDIALSDIDGDGVEEMAAIGPFHGSSFNMYRRIPDGLVRIYHHPQKMEFLHVVWGGKLRGENVFIGGCRGGAKELFLLRWKDGQVTSEVIESGAGPANVCVVNGKDRDLILTANHESGEGAVYVVED